MKVFLIDLFPVGVVFICDVNLCNLRVTGNPPVVSVLSAAARWMGRLSGWNMREKCEPLYMFTSFISFWNSLDVWWSSAQLSSLWMSDLQREEKSSLMEELRVQLAQRERELQAMKEGAEELVSLRQQNYLLQSKVPKHMHNTEHCNMSVKPSWHFCFLQWLREGTLVFRLLPELRL